MGLLSEVLAGGRDAEAPAFAVLVDDRHCSALAEEWLLAGVRVLAEDPDASLPYFSQAITLGSVEAVAWLGSGIVAVGLMGLQLGDEPGGRRLILAGLEWLRTGAWMGCPVAKERFAATVAALPQSIVAEWAALPAFSNITFH